MDKRREDFVLMIALLVVVCVAIFISSLEWYKRGYRQAADDLCRESGYEEHIEPDWSEYWLCISDDGETRAILLPGPGEE